MNELSIVVTDVTTDANLQRCLHQVLKTVPRDVEVVLVTPGRLRLAPSVARRLRRIKVTAADQVAEVVAREVIRDCTVVVLRSDVKVAPGWLEQIVAGVEELSGGVGILGPGDPHLVVYPANVTWVEATEQVLHGVHAVRVGSANRAAARPTTISVNLIVRDEEDVIESCLTAVKPFVDEMVVYDTGSVDRTVEIARSLGAKVVEGYWNDHFGDARNRALEHCTTEWVLILDADEVLTGDPVALRARLAGELGDVIQVSLVSTAWSGGEGLAELHTARLFRRTRATWVGALHEMLIASDGGGLRRAPELAPVRIVHSGYQSVRAAEKNKAERNLAISRAAVEALPADDAHDPLVWCNYGRSLVLADQLVEALTALTVVRANPTNAVAAVLAARAAVRSCFDLGRLDEIVEWVELAETHGEAAGQTALWRARLAMRRGDLDEASNALGGVVASRDVLGVEFDPAQAVLVRSDLARQHGRPAEAMELLLNSLLQAGEHVSLQHLLPSASAAGMAYTQVARSVPDAFIARSLRECVQMPPEPAQQWCAAIWSSRRDHRAVVAGCVVARALPVQSALVWALRARETGLVQHCPLRAIADDEQRAPLDRAVATAVLADALAEQPYLDVLAERLAAVPNSERPELAVALRTCAPGVMERLTTAIASVTG